MCDVVSFIGPYFSNLLIRKKRFKYAFLQFALPDHIVIFQLHWGIGVRRSLDADFQFPGWSDVTSKVYICYTFRFVILWYVTADVNRDLLKA